MDYFLIYIIKSTLCLTIFYLFFKALLSRETFFRFNRLVLLAGMIVCAVLPVIELKVSQATVIQEPVAKIEDFFIAPKTASIEIIPDNFVFIEPEIGILEYSESAGEIPISTSTASFSIVQIASIIYITGFFITLALLFVSIFKIIQIIRKGTKIKKG